MWQSSWGSVIESVRNENGDRLGVARLGLEPREIDRAAVEPRRRAGLEPLELEAQRRRLSESPTAAASPPRPPGVLTSPVCMSA